MANQRQIMIQKKLQASRKNGIDAILRTATIEDFQVVIDHLENFMDINIDSDIEKIDSAYMALIRVKNLLINCGVMEDITDHDSIDVGFSKIDLQEIGEEEK